MPGRNVFGEMPGGCRGCVWKTRGESPDIGTELSGTQTQYGYMSVSANQNKELVTETENSTITVSNGRPSRVRGLKAGGSMASTAGLSRVQ